MTDCAGKLNSALLLVLWLISCCALAQETRPLEEGATEVEGFQEVEDLYVVDCLLPGEVRRMGEMVFLSPRIPTRTTALDCRIRGGEYTAYSRASYQSALSVWQEQARQGDAQAQYFVGEIHEKGLGIDPDYERAAEWYRKAADQGFARAMISLAYLLQQGLGVEQDTLAALNWYRRASGLSEDSLIFAEQARERLEQQEQRLTAELDRARQERRVLSGQVEQLRARLTEESEKAEGAEETIATLERLLVEAEEVVDSNQQRLARLRGAKLELPAPDAGGTPPPVQTERFDFGRYFALVVGLQHYQHWDSLQSPHKDARELAELLNSRYGFDTTILLDASTREILGAINDLRERVGANDNVLIYFAGHGQLLRPDEAELRRGYWLPVNAERDRTTFWVPNSAINDHLALIDARSVLVVADSCYGGAMSTDPGSILAGSTGPVSERLVELGLSRQARYVLSSGGLHPVLDVGSGEHSVFARALIDVLNNETILREQDLFAEVSRRTQALAEPLQTTQRPELRPIRPAGHAAGSFFFVPGP